MELQDYADYEDVRNFKRAESFFAVERAICGAIGWLSAGANEANNGVYQETVKRLAAAASHFHRLGLEYMED